MSNKIGLLLSRSVIFPTMSFDMHAGLRLGLAELGMQDVDIRTENAGLGAEPRDIYTACEKLLFEGCRVVVGYVNPVAAEAVEPLFAGAGAIFVALDAGYQFSIGGIKLLPHVFTLSLDSALCCRIAARTAVDKGLKRIALVGSLYDAGYRGIQSFYRSMERSGGTVTFNLITPLKRGDFSLDSLLVHLDKERPNAIFAAFCGDMLQDFLNAMAANLEIAAYPVYGSPFVGDEIWLAQSLYPGRDMNVAVPWANSLENEGNLKFVSTMAANKQRSNIWSMLTWEAAGLVAVVLMYNTESAISALESFKFDGPRGHVKLNANTHKAVAPVYNGLVTRFSTGNCQLEIIGASKFVEEERQALEHDMADFDGQATSWRNAYGCLDS